MDDRSPTAEIRGEPRNPVSDAIYLLDQDGRFLSLNAAAETLLGYRESDLVGHSIFEVLPPDEHRRTADRLASRFRSGGMGDPFVTEIVDRAGQRRTIEVTSRILGGVHGQPLRLEGFARDVTDRKRAEDVLRNLAAMTAKGRGEDFFRTIARSVSETLRVKYVFIGMLPLAGAPRVQTLAVWAGDRFAPNFSYALAGTPCFEILGRDVVIHPKDLSSRYPGVTDLLDGDAQSFLGLPLWDARGQVHGILSILHNAPFEPSTAQLDMLRILAARAGSELDRLNASEALRLSEERFRQLAEQARDVLWVLELPNRRLAYLSPSFERLTGVKPARVQNRLHAVLSRIDSSDRRRLLEALNDALKSPGGGYAVEYRIKGRDGTIRWILDQGAVIRHPISSSIRINGVARDITSRKQAEIALAAERARFRDLFENSPDAVFVESIEGVVLDVNQAACDLHRLTRRELVGRHVSQLVPPHLREEVLIGFQRLASGEQSIAEGLSLRSDGVSVPVELRATRVTLPEGQPALLLHVRDISARKRAEDFLAGQKRILEWIATGRPASDVLSDLVRVTEARYHGIRCWVIWFHGDERPGPTILAPTFRGTSNHLLANLARRAEAVGLLMASPDEGARVVRNFAEISDSFTRLEETEQRRWASAIVVPIAARSGPRLGAFVAFEEDAATPPLELLDLLRLAASLAGVAIERHLTDATLRDGTERLRRANAALLELARSDLVTQGDLSASLEEITAAAARGMGVSRVNVWLFEENDTVLRCVSLFEAGNSIRDAKLELRVSDYPSYFEAVTRDRLVSVPDVENDARTAELLGSYFRPLGIASILDAGIRLRGRLVGIICLEHQGPYRAWQNEEELFAGSVADIVALAIQAGERRCIEEALRQSEEAYRSVVGALAEGVMLVNRDGSFVTFNDSAAEILGLTADYLQTHRLTDAGWNTIRLDGSPLPPEDYPAAVTLRTGEPITDSVMGVRRPDGRLVWLSSNTRPFSRDEGGRVTSVVVSFADITRRQQAERALREGHELLQAVSDVQAQFIADAAPARTFSHMLERLVRMTDSQTGLIGEVTETDGEHRRLTLYTVEGEGEDLGDLSEGHRAAMHDLLQLVVKSANPVLRSLPRSTPEAATDAPVEQLLGFPLRHDEEVVGVVVLYRRVSAYEEGLIRRLDPLLITCANLIRAVRIDRQREQAEARIRQLNSELEQRVEERTADLRSTNEELAEFAYVVTHDLKAPLRGIHQLSEWLSQDHASRLDAEGLRLLGLLRGRVKHLQRMIDGLLACAKVARTPEPESSVSSLLLVREVAGVLAPPPHITIEAAPDLPVIWGNPDRLYQIFQNLLDNAVKYLDKPIGRVRVSASRRRGDWEFRVTDNGPGIPKRYQEKVFQIFQRLDPGGQIPGTGLGLTLVKRIVESRGGHIWIESTEGEGTSICFTWPDRARQRAVT
ncbi:MAG: PAS domain S-box protein [Verrucomicrobiales bacterium]|nr:PAS domain S-box protein [Verrucomicrobiales bacterium]